jgi:hypothetical protein
VLLALEFMVSNSIKKILKGGEGNQNVVTKVKKKKRLVVTTHDKHYKY